MAALLVFTLIVRTTVLWSMRNNLNQDPDAYREIAENLLVYGEFALGKPDATDGTWQPRPTAYRPPLYPILLSNLPAADGSQLSLTKVAALHLLLGAATVWLTWLTARRVGCAHHRRQLADTARPTNSSGPEARQEVAPTVRSGLTEQPTTVPRSGGPTQRGADNGDNPPGLTLPPIIAALLVACDPLLLNQQTLVMTETLAAFLTILSLWCLTRFDAARTPFNAAMAGGAIGLAILCRPTFLPWLGLVGLGMVIVRSSNAERGTRNVEAQKKWLALINDIGRRTMNLAGLVIVAATVISPWAIRNYRVFGKPIVTTTHGGYTLYLSNSHDFYEYLAKDRPQLPFVPSESDQEMVHKVLGDLYRGDTSGMGHRVVPRLELSLDKANYEAARRVILERPAHFVRACLYRVIQLWSPLPHKLTAAESTGRRLLRYATCAWYYGVFALAAAGICRLRWQILQPPWVWGLLLCLVFTAVHTFYWTNMRMRAPLMPFIALVAAAAIGKPHK